MGLVPLGDGFALMHNLATEIPAEEPADGEEAAEPTYTYALQLDIYDAANTIVASQTWPNIGLGSPPAMSINANGNINILAEVMDALKTDVWGNSHAETRAMVVTPSGDVISDVFLSNTYSYLNSVSQSANGNWICSFEYGGPDSTAFAVLNSAGELVAGPQTYTEHEPTEIASLAFRMAHLAPSSLKTTASSATSSASAMRDKWSPPTLGSAGRSDPTTTGLSSRPSRTTSS